MTVEKIVSINLALGIADTLVALRDSVDILPFKISNRIDRQLTKLAPADKARGEAVQATVKSIVGDKKYEKLVADKAQISDALTEKQLVTYNKMMAKELEAEVTVGLLSESFVKLIEDMSFNKELTQRIIALTNYYDANVWNPVEEVVAEEA